MMNLSSMYCINLHINRPRLNVEKLVHQGQLHTTETSYTNRLCSINIPLSIFPWQLVQPQQVSCHDLLEVQSMTSFRVLMSKLSNSFWASCIISSHQRVNCTSSRDSPMTNQFTQSQLNLWTGQQQQQQHLTTENSIFENSQNTDYWHIL